MRAREMLKAALIESGLTQVAVAKLAGYGAPYVSDIFLGNRPIGIPAARKLCPILGLSPHDVLKQQVDDDLEDADAAEVSRRSQVAA